jgi:ATP-dependent DNA ligase
MECLPVTKLPQGPEWSYEIKLDGFRVSAVKKNGETTLYSRRGNILNRKFHYIATALKKLPDNTVLDGELVALDSDGKSDFGLLQNSIAAWIYSSPPVSAPASSRHLDARFMSNSNS